MAKIKFPDHPEFTPNLTPRQMFKLGSFGGTYWRPIHSSVKNKSYKNVHHKKGWKKKWFYDIPESQLSSEKYDKNKNKYKVKVGTTLEFWENSNWISEHDPYGWVMWYCNFFSGRRIKDEDERQIKRWLGVAGDNGRFKKWLVTLIQKKGGEYNDFKISPKIRQTLQHWGYKLTKADYLKILKERKK